MRAVLHVLTNLPQWVAFVGFFFKELVVANARVAWEILTPSHRMRAGIVLVETRCETGLEVMLLANSISMTPGTLSIEVAHNERDIYVHTLYAEPLEDFRAQVARMEQRLLEALR